MPSRLKDNLNSQYFEAANALTSKQARRRIVAYVESYDDIFFWRTVLSRFENEQRYFEVMLPSNKKLERGKKSVLMNFVGDRIGPDMIACVDADFDYLLQGVTAQSKKVIESPYVFHTYAYAIENLQCYAPSLHDVCVAVTLNDHRIFDFIDYLRQYSEAIFPLFVWSVWAQITERNSLFHAEKDKKARKEGDRLRPDRLPADHRNDRKELYALRDERHRLARHSRDRRPQTGAPQPGER